MISTNDEVRKYIIEATGDIASHIEDGTILAKFVEQLFDFFKANSSKVPQRTSIATAILYACKKSKSSENLESVISKFAAIFPTES